MNKKYYQVIGIAILVLIAIVGAIIMEKSPKKASEPAEQEQEGVEATGTQSQGVARTAKKESGLSYQQVVEKYLNARIQFNDKCQATPASVTFKSGTSVMFDNRTSQKQIISLDGRGYAISQYGFIILPLTSKTLPHTIKVDCNQQYNVANILLQK